MSVLLKVFVAIILFVFCLDMIQLWVGMIPSSQGNNQPLYFNGTVNLNYLVSWNWFYTSNNGTFAMVCPNLKYDVVYTHSEETVAILSQNYIYDGSYSHIYTIEDAIFHHNLKQSNGSVVSVAKYNYLDDSYTFVDILGSIGTAIKINNNWVLNATREVDLRLYDTFLIYLSYRDYNALDTCNNCFMYSLSVCSIVMIGLFIIAICQARYKYIHRNDYILMRDNVNS